MQYKELREMTVKEWDGVPFKAYVVDSEDASISHPVVREVVGYRTGFQPWQCENVRYKHVYPVKWNEEKVKDALKPKRMTNLQLAKWLAKGSGQIMYLSHVDLSVDNSACLSTTNSYGLSQESFECNDRIRVRKWDSEEWIEPTVDLLEGK